MTRRLFRAALALLLCAAFLLPAAALAWRADPVTYANADAERYTIVVDLTNKIVTIYEREGDDAYAHIARQSLCTIGAKETATPAGSWRLNERRRRFGYFREFDCYAQYWVNVVGGIYFHSILYNEPVEGKFTRTSYNALGGAASHGCIRMLVEDVRWMYYNCPPGTLVVVTKNRAPNPELVESLKPKLSASQYYPEPDAYEAANLALPKGVARRGSVLTDANGGFAATIAKGEEFDVLLSGYPKSKIRLRSGETGMLENNRILFLDNSPGASVHVIKSDADVYARPSNVDDPIGTLEKGAPVTILQSTNYFHRVKSGKTEGYVLKSRVDSQTGTLTPAEIEDLLDLDDKSEEISFPMLRVKSAEAPVYITASNRSAVIARFAEGTDLVLLSSTTNFHKVRVDGKTGYILKRDCHTVNVIHTGSRKYELQVFQPGVADEDVVIEEEAPPADE